MHHTKKKHNAIIEPRPHPLDFICEKTKACSPRSNFDSFIFGRFSFQSPMELLFWIMDANGRILSTNDNNVGLIPAADDQKNSCKANVLPFIWMYLGACWLCFAWQEKKY